MVTRHTPDTLKGIPIAPGGLPLVGHLRTLYQGTRESMVQFEESLGPVFWISLGFGNWLVMVSGEAAHQVLKNRKTESVMPDERLGHLLHNSMLVANGEPHRRMRGSMNAPFTPKGMSAAKVGEVIGEVLHAEMAQWRAGTSLRIAESTSEMALDVIFRVLGVPNEEIPLWRKQYSYFNTPGLAIPIDLPGTPMNRSRKSANWLEKEFAKLVKKARAEGDQETMLGALAHGKDEKGRVLNEEELLANLRILAFAGHETTASIMAWMMLHAAKYPEVWDKLCTEANSSSALPTTPQDLAHFPYAEALFRECLRLYPPVAMVTRRVIEPMEVSGHTLPPGTMVTASVLCMSMNPADYPEPAEMRPERWLERDRKPGSYETIQFGGGPHFCLGYHMAVMEGTQFIVYAARILSEKGLRPTLDGAIPQPIYLTLTHPPAKAKVRLQSVS